jgi:LPXTG-motif cell wall-anchored protein
MASIDQMIYDTAISQGFNPKAAKLIVAQARFESADYTSNVFKNNNNTSGIKFIGQPNAVQGTLSPEGNYYAKFNTIQDSINDKIVRLYNITMGGVTPKQLKDSTDVNDFANKLKKRGYYGSTPYGTSQATSDITNYANGLKAKLLKINVIEFIKNNITTLGIGLILIGIGGYYYLKNKNK